MGKCPGPCDTTPRTTHQTPTARRLWRFAGLTYSPYQIASATDQTDAERLAEVYFGDETWREREGLALHVGQVPEDGTRSDPLVEITVVQEKVDEEED